MELANNKISYTKNLLQIFAKAPIPGQVKTRLIPTFSPQQAAQLHQQLVTHCLTQFSQIFTTQLWCAPNIYHPFFQACQTNFNIKLHCQQGIYLGSRMAYAIANSKANFTVLIGSDCPNLNVSMIQQAFKSLENYHVVLAPAEDGGYVLIGMRKLIPKLFIDIDWGTANVFTQTKNILTDLKIAYYLLPTQWDVDYPQDVKRWYAMKNLY